MEDTRKSEREQKKETLLGEEKECSLWYVLGKESKKDKYKQSFKKQAACFSCFVLIPPTHQ